MHSHMLVASCVQVRCGGKLFLSKPGICQLSTTTKDPENKIRRDWKAHLSAKLDQRTGSKDSNAFCDEERKKTSELQWALTVSLCTVTEWLFCLATTSTDTKILAMAHRVVRCYDGSGN